MPKKQDKNLVVGLDIGTSKVVAVVGEQIAEDEIKIVGLGVRSSEGLKKGVVVNIDATVEAIQRAVEEAELMAGCQIHSVYAGIANNQIKSFNSHGVVAIENNEVTTADVGRVIDAAKAVAIPADQKILHVLPQEFIVDTQDGIQTPVGMSGVRLEAKVHMVTSSVSSVQNIVKCVRRCGLEVDDVILAQLASSHAVLTPDEKQLGVCLVDIGAGTTSISVYLNGAICLTKVLPVAGAHVSNDIAIALRTPLQNAECIKIEHGYALEHIVPEGENIEIAGVGDRLGRTLSAMHIARVIEPRYAELFALINNELQRENLTKALGSGIVFTGGAVKIAGVEELASEVFQLPVRIGVPRNVSGLEDVVNDPCFATSIGLLHYGFQTQVKQHQEYRVEQGFRGVVGRMKSWFQGNF